jgi:secretion/DNA translocation related TadE-like protein
VTRRNRWSETGSAAVLVCVLAGLSAALALGLTRLAVASVAAARAETAADAAALAAAWELAAGRSEHDAARIAEASAAANGARLVDCDCRGPGATVKVAVLLPRPALLAVSANASARAATDPDCPG